MSSIVGHCIVALGVERSLRQQDESLKTAWFIAFAIAACIPDIDYLLLWMGFYYPIRVSHSFVMALAFPMLMIVMSRVALGSVSRRFAIGVMISGSSHILLDLLVGVTANPIFWPFTSVEISLPFGILPSAGALKLDNFYLYRNLVIELGILLPLLIAVIFLKQKKSISAILLTLAASTPFLLWSINLQR